jgi:glycosyltransferase involved in cell wall biosynthesis
MENYQIIGIILIKDEDLYIERVLQNITDFCDVLIVADNYSQDRTYDIITSLAEKNPKVSVHRIQDVRESHTLIEEFAGTNTWIFAVDGDEIYDPGGLLTMRQQLSAGVFDESWCIYGNVLNCVSLDVSRKIAKGHLAPPCRSMTKLYNFSLIRSWVNCKERLHGGKLSFKDGYVERRHELESELSWEESYFRCLHTVFLKRSSIQKRFVVNTRLNPHELLQMKKMKLKGRRYRLTAEIEWYAKSWFRKDWKNIKYRRGPLVEKNVSAFFPE